ncbi:hypothetical protein ACFX2B_010546 [Malus domestica]
MDLLQLKPKSQDSTPTRPKLLNHDHFRELTSPVLTFWLAYKNRTSSTWAGAEWFTRPKSIDLILFFLVNYIHRPYSVVAVKKLWRSGTDVESGDNFISEVNLLGRLRHRNIVRLLGYLHNEHDVVMIYEFMPNGNLGTALHGNQAGKLLVDWVSRYNIAVGVAQALNYLHHDCQPPVIHRDIKSNNILLDTNLDARVADFGLARTMIHKNETVSMVAGSYGYIAPEYGYALKVDEKTDIYSYGVVLKMRSKRALEETLDPSIAGECKHVQEEMLLVLRMALLCTAKLPKDRPSMRDIITVLGEAKPRRKSICESRSQKTGKEKPIFSTSPVMGLL